MVFKGFQKRSRVRADIPQASLADMACLLLIFFMVSTRFPSDQERPIAWTEAAAAIKVDAKQADILNVWLQRDGAIFINDQRLEMDAVSDVVGPLHEAAGEALVISIRGDRDTPYALVDRLQKELVSAGVVRVVFATRLEQRLQGQRR
jgi:biopolymer transport protein ExbD/biopolymer transport protein TolR